MENKELPLDRKEALINGLVLAVTAPTDEKAQEVVQYVNKIANGMRKSDVEHCKKTAAYRIKKGLFFWGGRGKFKSST